MKRIASVFVAAGLVLAALAAPAAAAPDPNCVAPIDFWSFKALDNKTVIVTSRNRHDYRLSLAPGCFDMNFAFRLGIKSFSTSRLSCVARGDWVIVPRDGAFPGQRCMIDKVEAYTPEMAHADAVAKAMSKPR